MLTILSLYSVRRPLSNQSPCTDVSSESHHMVLHTTNITPYQYNHATSSDVATPQATSSSYQIMLPPAYLSLRVSHRLRCSVTQFVPHHPAILILTPLYLCTASNRNRRRLSSNCPNPWAFIHAAGAMSPTSSGKGILKVGCSQMVLKACSATCVTNGFLHRSIPLDSCLH